MFITEAGLFWMGTISMMSNYNYYNNYFNCFDIIQVWESEG